MAQVAARVSDEEKKALEEFCETHDIKLSQLVRWALRDYIEKIEPEKVDSSIFMR